MLTGASGGSGAGYTVEPPVDAADVGCTKIIGVSDYPPYVMVD